ncbi:DUF1853 family protein [Vibrio breoganii]
MPNTYVDVSTLSQFADWIATTPPLLHGDEIIVEALPFQTLCAEKMHTYTGNPRLGFIYQYLCEQLFIHHPSLSITTTELQLSDNGRTIGELDFILHNHQHDRFEHWEVAIKFYLLHGDKWYGPNAIDRLDKKLKHMLERQLQHTQSDIFIRQYPQWKDLSQHLLMQGRLYINPFEAHTVPTHCEGKKINTSQVVGYWCHQNQANQIDEKLYRLDKPLWATGRTENSPLLDGIQGKILHCQSESGRFWFIVPDDWPNNI